MALTDELLPESKFIGALPSYVESSWQMVGLGMVERHHLKIILNRSASLESRCRLEGG